MGWHMRRQCKSRRSIYSVESLETRQLLAVEPPNLVQTFVTNPFDDNSAHGIPGSLRAAILDANAAINGNMLAIHFNIPGAGVHIINLVSVLPTIDKPVFIDGYTQPGSHPNTL